MLVVSRGPELVTVPRVVGTTVGAARAALSAAGLRAQVHELFGGDSGIVFRQHPAAGTQVPPGSAVVLGAI